MTHSTKITFFLFGMALASTAQAQESSICPNGQYHFDPNSNRLVCHNPAQAQESPKTWHLMTQSEGGIVSHVTGLSKEECEKMREDLDPWVQHGRCSNCSFMVQAGDIKMSKCFQ